MRDFLWLIGRTFLTPEHTPHSRGDERQRIVYSFIMYIMYIIIYINIPFGVPGNFHTDPICSECS